MSDEVMAIGTWASNAALIADCARLGYLRRDWTTLDCTYGIGTFWKKWRPDWLVGSDINPFKSPVGVSVDATKLPWPNQSFDCVVIDGPYKLNGTPNPIIDTRYGIEEVRSRQERMDLLRDMLLEGARVLGKGFLLFKCQDQVNGGQVRWQTDIFTRHGEDAGLRKVDRLDMLSYRPQPASRRQLHARRNASTLLVFTRC